MSYFRKLYEHDELPQRAKLVYIYLFDRCDKEKKAWPSVKRIAKDLSISEKTVRRAVKDLEKAGLIRTKLLIFYSAKEMLFLQEKTNFHILKWQEQLQDALMKNSVKEESLFSQSLMFF